MADGSAIDANDPRSPDERWLDMVRAARDQRPDRRRWAVRGLIHEGLRLGVGSVPTAFELAYDDPGGGDYWATWLHDVRRPREAATLLALHVVAEGSDPSTGRIEEVTADELKAIELARLARAFADFEPGVIDLEAFARWAIGGRARAHLVPPSLSVALAPAAADSREPGIETVAKATGRPRKATPRQRKAIPPQTAPATAANRARGDVRREKIRELKEAHPSWTLSRIATELGSHASTLARLLGPEKDQLFPPTAVVRPKLDRRKA